MDRILYQHELRETIYYVRMSENFFKFPQEDQIPLESPECLSKWSLEH